MSTKDNSPVRDNEPAKSNKSESSNELDIGEQPKNAEELSGIHPHEAEIAPGTYSLQKIADRNFIKSLDAVYDLKND